METIKINDVEYMKSADCNTKVDVSSDDVFSVSDQIKMDTILSRHFSMAEEYMDDRKALETEFMIMEHANVVGIIPKTKRAKLLLRKYQSGTIPKLGYTAKEGVEIKSKYSLEYFGWIIRFLNIDKESESVTLLSNKDYPLTMETANFKVVLAPRVDND